MYQFELDKGFQPYPPTLGEEGHPATAAPPGDELL